MIELELVGVTPRPKSDEQKRRLREQAQAFAEQPDPWVRLREGTGDRVLEFGIGTAEAAAIASALHGGRQPKLSPR